VLCLLLYAGGSSGSAMYCAVQAAKDFNLTAEHRVVVILPDSVRNYMLVNTVLHYIIICAGSLLLLVIIVDKLTDCKFHVM